MANAVDARNDVRVALDIGVPGYDGVVECVALLGPADLLEMGVLVVSSLE